MWEILLYVFIINIFVMKYDTVIVSKIKSLHFIVIKANC